MANTPDRKADAASGNDRDTFEVTQFGRRRVGGLPLWMRLLRGLARPLLYLWSKIRPAAAGPRP